MKKYALIVAGGSGIRMGSEVPKQFLLLNGKPILMQTIELFAGDIHVIVVLPSLQIETWEALCNEYKFTFPHQITAGGESRFHSVQNGLQLINEGLVAIHDGVRPLVSSQLIDESFRVALLKGNAVAAVKVKESIRENIKGGTRSVNRDHFYMVQTPQTFRVQEIKAAYQHAERTDFTDDASLFEELTGATINLIDGEYSNIKITTPDDHIMASALQQVRKG